jgi:hypothetical protein
MYGAQARNAGQTQFLREIRPQDELMAANQVATVLVETPGFSLMCSMVTRLF